MEQELRTEHDSILDQLYKEAGTDSPKYKQSIAFLLGKVAELSLEVKKLKK